MSIIGYQITVNCMVDKKKIIIPLIIALLLIAVIVYWYNTSTQKIFLRVTTTTSLYATGLLDKLAEEFHKQHPNVIIQFIAVGSGEALRKASMGDADMVFVHAPSLEKQYIDKGVLIDWGIMAYNTFIIVGPSTDPAGIKGLRDPVEAFKKIYYAGEEGKALFVSRGDNSGTNVRELALWRLAGLDPHGKPWYIESGTGMTQTLMIANEKNAYTLSDIGTYTKLKLDGDLPYLEVMVDNGTYLLNIYSVYIVNPDKYSNVNYEYAKMFRDFVLSSEGQKIIASYGVDKYGRPLFYPAQGKEDWLHKQWEKLVALG